MLRTDLFKTVERAATKYIAVRDTLTKPKDHFDITTMDKIHCRQGRLGVGYHFLVLTDGTIQLGRDVDTCGSHSRNLDAISVAIGVVGGTDDEGQRALTRTVDQWESIDDLIRFLSLRYPEAVVDDRPDP